MWLTWRCLLPLGRMMAIVWYHGGQGGEIKGTGTGTEK